MCCLKLHLELCRNSNLVSFTMINAFWESQAKSKYFMTLFWRRGKFYFSYVFKTTSNPLLLSKWYRTDGVIVSVPMIAVIGVVETSTPERQTSPPFVSSPIQLNQMRELSKKTVKFCQKKTFLSLEYLIFSNFNALLVKVSSPID